MVATIGALTLAHRSMVGKCYHVELRQIEQRTGWASGETCKSAFCNLRSGATRNSSLLPSLRAGTPMLARDLNPWGLGPTRARNLFVSVVCFIMRQIFRGGL